MKSLIFTLLLVFSASVFAETYLCTRNTSIGVYEDNKVNKRQQDINNDIHKLKIDYDKKKIKYQNLNQKILTHDLDILQIVNDVIYTREKVSNTMGIPFTMNTNASFYKKDMTLLLTYTQITFDKSQISHGVETHIFNCTKDDD